jgi:hypothetical protein
MGRPQRDDARQQLASGWPRVGVGSARQRQSERGYGTASLQPCRLAERKSGREQSTLPRGAECLKLESARGEGANGAAYKQGTWACEMDDIGQGCVRQSSTRCTGYPEGGCVRSEQRHKCRLQPLSLQVVCMYAETQTTEGERQSLGNGVK